MLSRPLWRHFNDVYNIDVGSDCDSDDGDYWICNDVSIDNVIHVGNVNNADINNDMMTLVPEAGISGSD